MSARDLLRLYREGANNPRGPLPLFVATFLHPDSMQKAMDVAVDRATPKGMKPDLQQWTPYHFNVALRFALTYQDYEPKAPLLVQLWRRFSDKVVDDMSTQLYTTIEESMQRSESLRRVAGEPFGGVNSIKARYVRPGPTALTPFHGGHHGGFSFDDWMKRVGEAREGRLGESEEDKKSWVFH